MPAVMKKKSTRGWSRTPFKKTTTAKVATLTKQIRRIKRSQELKWFDVNLTSATGGQVEPLNNIPLGDDAVSRDGRKIMMTSCVSKGQTTSATLGTYPRYAIVYDASPNGILPSATDIFTATDAVAQVNLNNRNRFKILWDNHAGLGMGRDPFQFTGGTGTSATYIWHDTIKLRDLITIYKDTGSGTMAGTATGALYAVFLGTGSVTGAAINFRIRFLDS